MSSRSWPPGRPRNTRRTCTRCLMRPLSCEWSLLFSQLSPCFPSLNLPPRALQMTTLDLRKGHLGQVFLPLRGSNLKVSREGS